MRRRSNSQSTFSRLYEIGGAELALCYHEMSERARAAQADSPAQPIEAPPTPRRVVCINGLRIGDNEVAALERAWNSAVADGRYWYDAACGAWGIEGGPCRGFIQAGLALGGALAANASGGGTGVFVNGRELHPADVASLRQIILIIPGRYRVDAAGNFGWEAGPALGNLGLLRMAAARRAQWPWSR